MTPSTLKFAANWTNPFFHQQRGKVNSFYDETGFTHEGRHFHFRHTVLSESYSLPEPLYDRKNSDPVIQMQQQLSRLKCGKNGHSYLEEDSNHAYEDIEREFDKQREEYKATIKVNAPVI